MNFDQDLLNIDEEQFVLLSAYMDGEATADEVAQVEQWLAQDAVFARVYEQQKQLQKMLIDLPVPAVATDAFGQRQDNTELVVAGVMERLDRRAKQRRWIFGGIGLVAATLVGALASILTVPNSPQLRHATNQVDSKTAPVTANKTNNNKGESGYSKDEKLVIAMEEPLVPMPKSME
jgi:anti-sigma factor RsiW